METIVVCVCTYRRPRMLQECLGSLVHQALPEDVAARIVVIDNEAIPRNRLMVERMGAVSRIPMHFVHEPKRGIAAARNAAIDEALRLKADWIAFIDDDERAAPDWIAELMQPRYRDTPVLMGETIKRYPEPMPFWGVEKPYHSRAEGEALKTAYTCNVRFSADLVIDGGLRFDEQLGLMGGEDQEFFSAAHRLGFAIRYTRSAWTFEHVHRERLTYRAQMYRAYWQSASDIRELAIRRGHLFTAMSRLHTIPFNLIAGPVWLLAAPIGLAAGLETFKVCALRGGRKIAKAIGRAVGLLGHKPQAYRKVVGA